jgi:21S rRNA (GM2251-2'-O)-methyltransferase
LQGCILEASALPRPPVLSLGRPRYIDAYHPDGAFIRVETAPQSPEEIEINGNPNVLRYVHKGRLPFVLFIDDVLDPGNLGAIIRSAYYLGVEAIALSSRTCAPMTPTALKASAGAAEAIPIFKIVNPDEFINKSKEAGWTIYGGITPEVEPKMPERSSPFAIVRPPQVRYTMRKDGALLPLGHSPVKNSAVILVLGGEGRGLRKTLAQKAYAFVEVLPQMDVNECGVDSLNVSVAAALLCADMLRPRPPNVEAAQRLPPDVRARKLSYDEKIERKWARARANPVWSRRITFPRPDSAEATEAD